MAPDFGFRFNDIFRAEIKIINKRRRRDQEPLRPDIVLTKKGQNSTGEPVLVPNDDGNLVGLALSGGGIRSAAFCLGALQALDEARVLDHVDYLSTVSGGGYIGCSLSAGLEATKGEFPFKIDKFDDETLSTQHIRDHSNYLFPRGAMDVLRNASIYIRGLVANFVPIMLFLLVAAALTIFWIRSPEHLKEIEPLHITGILAFALVVVTIGWALIRSTGSYQRKVEAPSGWTSTFGTFFLMLSLIAFVELQPIALKGLVEHASKGPVEHRHGGFAEALFTWLAGWINAVAAFLAPIAAVIGFLGHKLGEFLKSSKESSSLTTQVAGYAAKAAIYVAAVAVPVVLWAIYLNLSYWGICGTSKECSAPAWLLRAASSPWLGVHPVAKLYVLVAAALFILTLFLRPNANSLHPLYRDRLGKAFLFNPKDLSKSEAGFDRLNKQLSWLSGQYGPYHLINTALNIQNSKIANKRGRNADFFLLSSRFVGSEATGYVATEKIEYIARGFDLATAMAVSGAAASSNMGSQSIKPLTPTLAILNIRLGYWLRNPNWFRRAETKGSDRIVNPFLRVLRKLYTLRQRNILVNYYLLAEMFGALNEHLKSVYLTDGGHIENLGLYELLKRRCRVIIALDAEADPELAFGSFNTLVRYARIDLGIEIELPWAQITDASRKTGKTIDETGDTEKNHGPHCAVGRICYPTCENDAVTWRTGVLIYIKSSLTGDENDYVFHYKRRYSRFPHETTVDQMFSEEQFEAYRALGYHAVNGFFDHRDDFAKLDATEFPDAWKDLDLLDSLFPRRPGAVPRPRPRFGDWFTTDECNRRPSGA